MNSNTFQDQPGQEHSYKFGSLSHVDAATREQAIAHNRHCIEVGRAIGSTALTVWVGDGSNFPGQIDMGAQFAAFVEDCLVDANWHVAEAVFVRLVGRTLAFILPFVRHALLLFMAALSLAVDFSATKLAILATLALADALATPYLFVTLRLWTYPRRALALGARLFRPCASLLGWRRRRHSLAVVAARPSRAWAGGPP